MNRRHILTALSALALGCDDALVDADYLSEALFSAEFKVEGFQNFPLDDYEHPRWGLFVMPGGLTGDICQVVELPDSSQPLEVEKTELNVFTVPDKDLWVKAPSGARYALLRAMAYSDDNENGKKDHDELFIGDAAGGLMYLPEAVTEADGPTGVALPEGYHNIFWGGPCGPVPRGTDDEDDCQVTLGAPCTKDKDCGRDGVCLTTTPNPGWEGGYCSVPADADHCAPEGGRLFAHRSPDSGLTKVWLKACDSDDDCRGDDGYTCNAMVGACYRKPTMRVVLGRPSRKSVCSQDFALDDDATGGDGDGPMSSMDDDDAGMPGDTMNGDGPPEDCVPPDPRCDGMPGGGEMSMDMMRMDEPMSGGGPPEDCVPPDPRCDGMPGGGQMDGMGGPMMGGSTDGICQED